MQLANYLGLLHRAELELGKALRETAEAHEDEPDVHAICVKLAADCDKHAEQLEPFAQRYGEEFDGEPDALMRDLHRLYLMASESDIAWTLIGQAAQGARDEQLLETVQTCEGETAIALKWLATRMKQAAPQTLVVK